MTDEPLDPLDDLAAYADRLGFEIDTSELEPEPLPEYGDDAFVMPDDDYDGFVYDDEPAAEDYSAYAQAEQQAAHDLDASYVELQQQLGRPLTTREEEAMAAGMQEQLDRGHDLDPQTAYFTAMEAAGQEPLVLGDDASPQDLARWAQERYGDLTTEAPEMPTQAEVDAAAQAAEGNGPQAHAARTKIATWQMQGVVGMRGD